MKLEAYFQAVKDGQIEKVKLGIESGIDCHAKNENGQTALDIACDAGYEDIVEYLLNIQSTNVSTISETDDPICIVGFNSIFPNSGTTPEDFWETLSSDHHAMTDVPAERWSLDEHYDPDRKAPGKMYTRSGGFIEKSAYGFDADFFNILPKEAEIMDPQQRIMLETIWYAMEHAGINPATLKDKQVGVFCGIMTHDYADMMIQSGIEHNNFIGTGNGASVLSGRVSYFFGFQGPSITIDTACSSSLVTTHQACTSLRLGECDVAFSAGVNMMLAPGVTINCCKANMLSAEGSCKTFSAEADGYARGEGCGVVVLKRYKDAIRDNNRIYGIVRGSAVNQDGASSGLTVPNKQAQIKVIERALNQAHLSVDDIDYIEAHGTGTPTGDPIEINALKEVFSGRNEKLNPILVSSAKTYVGHLEAAAGVAGLIKVLLSLEQQTLPALPVTGALNPKIQLENSNLTIQQKPHAWRKAKNHTRRAGISSFGFSGTNAHLIVEENSLPNIGEQERLRLQWADELFLDVPSKQNIDAPLQLFTLSAKTNEALIMMVERYIDSLSDENKLGSEKWLDLVYSAQITRKHFPCRLAIAADSIDSCLWKLKQAASSIKSRAKHEKISIGVNIPSLDKLDISSFRQRYREDALFRSIFDGLKSNIDSNQFHVIQQIMLDEDSIHSVRSTTYRLACMFAVYAMHDRYQRLGLMSEKIVSEGSGHYLAAVLDGRLSLSNAVKLYEVYIAENGSLYQQISRQVVIHKSKGLWDCSSADLCAQIYNNNLTIKNSNNIMAISLASASHRELIETMNVAYEAGLDLNWQSYWQGSLRQSVQLPQYPFQREHYHFKPALKHSKSNAIVEDTSTSDAQSYQLGWSSFNSDSCNEINEIAPVMLFKATEKQWGEIVKLADKMQIKPLWLREGKRSITETGFNIFLDNTEDWQWLCSEIKNASIKRIIDCSLLDIESLEVEASKVSKSQFVTKKLMNHHHCFNNLIEQKTKCDYFVYMPEQNAIANECVAMSVASLQGQFRSINLPQSSLVMFQLSVSMNAMIFALKSTLKKQIKGTLFKLQNEDWYSQALQVYRALDSSIKPYVLAANEGMVITGGLGALGLTLTRWFSEQGVKQFALMGRSKPTKHQQEIILELTEKHNVQISTFQVDVADEVKLNSTILAISKQFLIHTVFHLAGKASIVRFNKIQQSDYEESLSAKAIGAMNLKSALSQLPQWPSRVVFFSSSASILPELGQTTYAAANSVLDIIASRSIETNKPIQSINWGLWGAAGFGADVNLAKKARSGTKALSEKETRMYLQQALQVPMVQIAIFKFDWQEYIKHLTMAEREMVSSCLPVIHVAELNKSNQRHQLTVMPVNNRFDHLVSIIKKIIQSVTGLSSELLTLERKFEEELAIDSNLLTQIREEIQDAVGDVSAPFAGTLLFEHGNIQDLADFLINDLLRSIEQAQQENSPTEYIRKQVTSNISEVKIKLMHSPDKSSSPPLILIHTIMGSVFFYRPLVDFLEYQGEIYGVDDPYFSSLNNKFSSLKEMANAYAKAIKNKFGGRTVRLAGLSFAGCVAYEIAQQLMEMGEKVDNVLMLDTAMPTAGKLDLPSDHREYVMGEVAEDINQYYQAAINNNQKILNAYQPVAPKQGLRVILFKARSRDSVNKSLPSLNIECNGWLQLFCPEVYSVPGSHFSLFDRGYIHTTTQAMRYVYSLEKYFIDKHIKNDNQFNQQQLLIQAAKNGDSYLVLRLLQQGINPMLVDEEGNTAACYAALNDDLCSMAWLHYYAGSALNLTDLHTWAIRGKSLKVMSYLVEHANSLVIGLPDATLVMDTNKMQTDIFTRQVKAYSQREWIDILESHNASTKSAPLSGPMQILPPTSVKKVTESEIIQSEVLTTKIKCGNFQYDCISKLKKGDPSKPNLFMMHAASGLALPYTNLDDIDFGDVYGISNPYFGQMDKKGFETIEDMSRHYLEYIKSIQEKGPYYLAGWSLGGIVAAHMASLLEKQGENVGWVVMIDSVNHFGKPTRKAEEQTAINTIMEKHQSINRFEGMKEAINKCYLDTSQMLHKYIAPTFSGKIMLMKADEHEVNHVGDNPETVNWRQTVLSDPFSGWNETFPNLEICSVTGGHNELFEKQHITGIHSVLQSICKNLGNNEKLHGLDNRWCMNLLKALRRGDHRLIDLLWRCPEKKYSYSDSSGNLLDYILSKNDDELMQKLDKNGLSSLRTSTGSTAAEVALELGMLSLFDELDELNNQPSSLVVNNFFQPGSQEDRTKKSVQFSMAAKS